MPLQRVFFDTNIICNIRWIRSDATFENGFYDYKSQKFIKMDEKLRADCVALRWLIEKDDEFYLQFVTSKRVEQEILRLRSHEKRKELLEIYSSLKEHFRISQLDYLDESDLPPVGLASAQLLHRLDFLPQKTDRLLLVDSVRMQCHVFMTTDRKTIWKYQGPLRGLGINVQIPSEYVSGLLPPMSPGNIGLLPYGNIDDVLGK